MASRHLTLYESDLLQKSNVSPLRRGFETAAGPLILQSFCSPALVTSLKADRGLHAFTHVPEREHQLLLGIAERPDSALTLAYTPGGEIVGQVTRAPADPWWQGVANMHEEETRLRGRQESLEGSHTSPENLPFLYTRQGYIHNHGVGLPDP